MQKAGNFARLLNLILGVFSFVMLILTLRKRGVPVIEEAANPIGQPRSDSPLGTESNSVCAPVQKVTASHLEKVTPQGLKDASVICEHLHNNEVVLVDLSSVLPEKHSRILDFLSGAARASGAELRQMSRAKYLLTPQSVVVPDMLLETI